MTKITNEVIPPNQWLVESKAFINSEVEKLDGSGDLHEKIKMIYLRAMNISKDTILKSARSNLSNTAFEKISNWLNQNFKEGFLTNNSGKDHDVALIINNTTTKTQVLMQKYIVTGKKITPNELKKQAKEIAKAEFHDICFGDLDERNNQFKLYLKNLQVINSSDEDEKVIAIFLINATKRR